jgi:hypothetical protein
MLAAATAIALAIVRDYAARDIVPPGVSVAGHDMSGLDKAQLSQAIESDVSAPLTRPLTITGDGKTWSFDARQAVSIDLAGMLAEAYESRRSAPLLVRLQSELKGRPLPHAVPPRYAIDDARLGEWVAEAAKQIDRGPVDAVRFLVSGYRLRMKPSVTGARLLQASSVSVLHDSLSAEARLSGADPAVSLAIQPRRPKVTESSFKSAIVVSLNRCRIYLFKGVKLVKSYPCAPGRAEYPTPTGDFHIDSKLANAPWINPGDAWAAGMPSEIGPGPDNPMGVRKIGINYPGVFMHGIPAGEFDTIGTHASHACMRMFPSDVLDLYGRVRVGDPVWIRD